jgi:peroxiredoxin
MQSAGSVSVGGQSPDFTLPDLSGQSVTLSKLRGNVVVVDFWATWCGPCKAELPSLQDLYVRYKARGLVVLAVDVGESASLVKTYVSGQNYTFTVLLDSTSEVARRYGVNGIPATFVVDTQGVIRKTTVGYAPGAEKELEQAITPLLPR